MHPHIRHLTDAEIDSLEQVLGAPVDRQKLANWLSHSIEYAVRSASQPTPRQVRDSLFRFEREGRQWLRAMDESSIAPLLTARANLRQLKNSATSYCDRLDSLARQVAALVRGRPRTPAALELFVDNMIGIAKQAKVRPSTPSRSTKRKRDYSPPFFAFLTKTLRIARQMIRSSSLPEKSKRAALANLPFRSTDALGKLVVKRRGRIASYRLSSDKRALVEWEID